MTGKQRLMIGGERGKVEKRKAEKKTIYLCEKRKVEKEESGRKTESGMQSLPRHLQTLTEVDT